MLNKKGLTAVLWFWGLLGAAAVYGAFLWFLGTTFGYPAFMVGAMTPIFAFGSWCVYQCEN